MQQSLAALATISLVVIALAVLFGIVVPRIRRNRARERPIAIAPFSSSGSGLPPRPTVEMAAIAEPPRAAAAPQQNDVNRWAPPVEEGTVVPRHDIGAISRQTEHGRVLHMQVAGDPRRPVGEPPAKPRRTDRPLAAVATEGTLQFLPGKLEVVEGRDVGQELRFVATAGPDGSTVTFGRSEGPVYRHVQLHEQTVSRLHAKMLHENRGWALQNLSTTNPVVVNGAPLPADGGQLVLRDGDRIEMGEVIFRFRTR